MEELIKRLQDEVGLSEEEAIRTLSIVKEYKDKNDNDEDWEKLIKDKYKEFSSKTKESFESVSQKTQGYTDKLIGKMDDLADKARKKAHDLSQKAADYLENSETKD